MGNLMYQVQMLLIATLFAVSVWAGGGGDVVNNGGGLSEQSVLFAALKYPSFLDSCLRYQDCGAKEPMKAQLLSLKTCTLPLASQIAFKENLEGGKPYEIPGENGIILNRQSLYSGSREPMRIPAAFAFLTRVYFDLCGTKAFATSEEVVKPLERFAAEEGEQVTIGKESLNLPKSEWLRVRSLYSDLLIETPKILLRLSCPQDRLNECSFDNSETTTTHGKFRYLTLISEAKVEELILFHVEGYLVLPGQRQKFKLQVESRQGIIEKVLWQDQNIDLPEIED
jgi:hypothetical protein